MDRAAHTRAPLGTVGRVQRIIRARDALLQQACELLQTVVQSPNN
ncbi:MAG: hypothetical protein ACR2IT_06185 [Pirellulales bacterium]